MAKLNADQLHDRVQPVLDTLMKEVGLQDTLRAVAIWLGEFEAIDTNNVPDGVSDLIFKAASQCPDEVEPEETREQLSRRMNQQMSDHYGIGYMPGQAEAEAEYEIRDESGNYRPKPWATPSAEDMRELDQ